MKKLFLAFFILIVFQNVYSENTDSFNFEYSSQDDINHSANPSPMIKKVASEFNYSSFHNQEDGLSDLDLLMDLGDEANRMHNDQSFNLVGKKDSLSEKTDEYREGKNEIEKQNDKLNIEKEIKVQPNNAINNSLDHLSMINSNEKKEEINQYKESLDETSKLLKINTPTIDEKENKVEKMNVITKIEVEKPMITIESKIEKQGTSLENKEIPNANITNNANDMNDLNITIPPHIQPKNVEKKEEEKVGSITEKIKNLFEKKSETNKGITEVISTDKANNLVQVIDNTKNVKKIVKANSNTKIIQAKVGIKKTYVKKNHQGESEDNLYGSSFKIMSLSDMEDEINNKEFASEKYDSEYENKIYEYNKKKVEVSKKYKLNDYKIKVKVPEFLKSSENTIGNGHLNHIYYLNDYINALFAAILDENLAAIDSLLRVIKNVDIKNSQGDTLLIYAAKNKKMKSIRYLLMRGCNINISNSLGETIESIMIKNRDKQMLSLLK